jgi:hypothetical protein
LLSERTYVIIIGMMKDWDPDEALASLKMERQVTSESEEVIARRIFRENLVQATQAICHLATYGLNEKIRLDAAKYVVERGLGRLGEDAGNEDPFETLLAECVRFDGIGG